MITRREAIKRTVLGAAVIAMGSSIAKGEAKNPKDITELTYPFELPPLGYSNDAMEPFIDAKTMEFHHDKHHRAYVDNLNKALASHSELHGHTLGQLLANSEELPKEIRSAVRNNGGGHLNHSLFWPMLSKNGPRVPQGELGKLIDTDFGGFDGFKKQWTAAALSVFGSGWVWLTKDAENKLKIETSPNQDSPLGQEKQNKKILLALDVWEHAYYLKYQNRRAEYVENFFNVINWERLST